MKFLKGLPIWKSSKCECGKNLIHNLLIDLEGDKSGYYIICNNCGKKQFESIIEAYKRRGLKGLNDIVEYDI